MLNKIKLILQILFYYSNGYKFFLEKLGLIKSKYIVFRTRKGMKYKTRVGTTDYAILNETVILKEYLQHGFDQLDSNSTVVDFGAQAGDFSVYVAYTYGAQVHCYEPEPENFELVKENIQLNRLDQKVIATNAAVTNSNTTLKLRLSGWGNKGTHSFHYVEGGEYVEVPAIDILDLAGNFDRIDLLKIDIEGGEHEILVERNKPFFDKVDKLVMEYHTQPHVTNSQGLDHLTSVLTTALGFEVVAQSGDAELGVLYLKK